MSARVYCSICDMKQCAKHEQVMAECDLLFNLVISDIDLDLLIKETTLGSYLMWDSITWCKIWRNMANIKYCLPSSTFYPTLHYTLISPLQSQKYLLVVRSFMLA